MQNFSYADLARDHVLASLSSFKGDPNESAKELSELFDTFAGRNTIRSVAEWYVQTDEDCRVEETENEPHLDVDDFESALESAVNDHAEDLLEKLIVPEELESAKRSVQDNAGWRDYAKDVMATIRMIADADSENAETESRREEAAEHIGGSIENGYVYYFDDATQAKYRNPVDDLDQLWELLHSDDESVRADAYSHWCAETVSDSILKIDGHEISHDNSGVGHNWKPVYESDVPEDIKEEIAAEIIDGGIEASEKFVASSGLHYRWS